MADSSFKSFLSSYVRVGSSRTPVLAGFRRPSFSTFIRVFLVGAVFILILESLTMLSRSSSDSPQTSAQFRKEQSILWKSRQDAVRAAFRHAWEGYENYAMGHDELTPVTKGFNDWNHLGFTIFDSLDTAFIMGEQDIFESCFDWITGPNFTVTGPATASLFETTIRVLGGTLAGYHLSKRKELKDVAIRIGDRLMLAFDEDQILPSPFVDFERGRPLSASYGVSTAEFTSIQLEFKYLTHITGNVTYWNKVEGLMRFIDTVKGKVDGLTPIYMNSVGNFTSPTISIGANADSYYEYLGKQYLLTHRKETSHLRQYQESVRGIKAHLLHRSVPSNLLYAQELQVYDGANDTNPRMEHLACYLPGTMALMATGGTYTPPSKRSKLTLDQQEDLYIAEELTRTCYEMYHQTTTRLAPEAVRFHPAEDRTLVRTWLEEFRRKAGEAKKKRKVFVPESEALDVEDGTMMEDFQIFPSEAYNILRPETVESLFILFRITRDVKYREWGWKIFQAFENVSKVEDGGYSGLENVMSEEPYRKDRMESFFLGETLKYFYLLFSDDEKLIPLNKFVFNTEAHPLPIFTVRKDMKKLVDMMID
ncbi:hypothetical protein HDU97_002258 [Phlyctochytrium planicorne]|nr:hypothetical protein HDU97_002258 [Phlyctochytrium planicorne]